MKITIITAVYNSKSTIQQVFDSIKSQNYSDIEHIVIDGDSNDGTQKVIENNIQRVAKYISEKDQGLYDAINKGIRLATGDIIGILNADDLFYDNETLSRVASEFTMNGELDALYGDVVYFNEQGKITRKYSSKYFSPWMFRFGMEPAHPSFYCRKEVFAKLGLYAKEYKISGDFELMLRYIKKNNIRCKYLPFSFVKMRVGGMSTSGLKNTVKMNKEILKACRKNGIYTNSFFLYLKYFVKWWGFVFKS
ncbi:glycosyltransferase family 2 protein [Sphingobacterium sp.]|uniref:glycosyltransferase family 2 protein n=1 Tax=Sphingobacterium sp. TaxID=341027 RepID=UPI002899DA87|nr:glycosyltransferase family 2 protein [Sphingobacterium sp.]